MTSSSSTAAGAEILTDCPDQLICFWPSVAKGSPTGSPCRFGRSQVGDIPNIKCAAMNRPKYVHNNTRFRVHYYKSHNCGSGRIGSTSARSQGTLAGTYVIGCLRFR
ncbi:peptidase inhibitor family I36 protein [Micromonospora sp. NPDC000442]|uniref:peptidase inhibitor family I36 protein n=1 Tax=Micromonospora sp. NPDC000442 TaxID=3364217 RepID=UPI0036C0C7F6